MDERTLDAEEILRQLAAIREAMPFLQKNAPLPAHDGRVADLFATATTATDFDYAAIAEATASLSAALGEALDRAGAEMKQKCLDIYYAAEELSRDPEHAHLLPHVAQMRAAYERDYGEPIPPKR